MTMAGLTITSEFRLALAAVSDDLNVFITGKAGTGKSTLLRLIRDLDLGRATSVIAPTGVAALNVEGETIHRFFAFRPSLGPDLREYRPPSHLRDVDTLIVDEASMARADLLDMMDVALRRAKKSSKPFGGIQLILIGDLYQLPPVVTDADADTILKGYASPFFFSARALRSFPFETIELSQVFRQKDDRFIRLLNSIRDGTATEADLAELNSRVDPDFSPEDADSYITLATTNRAADTVNRAMLESLNNPIFTSTATMSGDFDPSHYAAEKHLSYSVGAQVMLLVNTDKYVNGSLGRVVDVADHGATNGIIVRLADSGQTVEVGPHTWEILRSVKQDGRIVKEVVGSLTQLPFRLAWSVTVHKSQGKTFDRVAFDRGRRVFAPGQLYVALSRCTTMDGLVLKKPLRGADVITDAGVKRFHARAVTRPRRFDQATRSYIGYVTTGGGEFSKLAEVAVIRKTDSGRKLVFESLINPLRDVSDAAESGIGASDLSLAPTVDDLRPPLAAVLSDTVLVTHGLDEFHRMMGWHHADVAEGLGVDLQNHVDSDLDSPPQSALAQARAAEHAARALADKELPIVVFDRGASRVPAGVYFCRRSSAATRTTLEGLDDLSISSEEALHLMLGVVAGKHEPGQALIDEVRVRAEGLGISSEALTAAAMAVHSRLVEASGRDGKVSPAESTAIGAFANALTLEVGAAVASEPEQAIELTPGLRVCFTGSPPAGDQHAELTKANLRLVAAALGLEETPSVTKGKCDLVVAFDLSSMSGKAKKAREFGKPVISSAEFLSLAAALDGS